MATVDGLLSLYELNQKYADLKSKYEALNDSYNDLLDNLDALRDMTEAFYTDGISNLQNASITSTSIESTEEATADAEITNSNTVSFTLGIPKGDDGAAGAKGADGTNVVFRIVEEEPDVEDMVEGEVVFVVSSSGGGGVTDSEEEEEEELVDPEGGMYIYNEATLTEFRDRVNAGETTLNGFVTANITLSDDTVFTPIGYYSREYNGTFEGFEDVTYTISNLNIGSNTGYQGLFGRLGSSAIIRNIRLDDVSIETDGATYVGAFAGLSVGGTLEHCYVNNLFVELSETPSGEEIFIGGLVGELYATARSSISYCQLSNIEITSGSDASCECIEIGGIVGRDNTDSSNGFSLYQCIVTNSNFTNFATSNYTYIGGLIALYDGTYSTKAISNCAVDTISINDANTANRSFMGGIIGFSSRVDYVTNITIGEVEISNGNNSGTSVYYGNAVGYNNGTGGPLDSF